MLLTASATLLCIQIEYFLPAIKTTNVVSRIVIARRGAALTWQSITANFYHHALTPEEFLKTSGVICKIIQKGVNFTFTPEVSADSSGVIHMS